jgi:two-component system phosphate regulon sensor histidine kinase PhoR
MSVKTDASTPDKRVNFVRNDLMQKKQFIKYLAIITVTVLAGIILLQLYWVITSYRQQKSRFKADIQNALSSANVKTTLKKAFETKASGLAGVIDVKTLTDIIERARANRKRNGDGKIPSPLGSTFEIKDTAKLLQYLNKVLGHSGSATASTVKFELTDKDMELYKAAYRKELSSREIYTSFELAIVSKAGNIAWSSCDSTLFKNIPFKSDVDEFPQVKTAASCGLQAAFPGGNLYLLRKMAWILSISILLIVIGSYSLGYLLIFFFNQKKLSDLRNDFMNNMTHELKTPISSVSIVLEMVLDESKGLSPEKKNSYLVIAQKELKRLDQLTENILKILSVERAEIKIVRSNLQLLPWLQSITDTIKPLLEDKGARLSLTVIPETMEIAVDKVHMANVMYNIIENAIKYNNKTHPEIKIQATQHEHHLFLQVSDNGEGIPDQYIKNVFDKFFRVPKGDRHDVKGYGLGLSYVKGIVELHEGTIQVSSILHTGSTFTIDLPLN